MIIIFHDDARKDLKKMDGQERQFFHDHVKKLAELPPRRHLKYGLPVHVDNVGQGRIIYQLENEALYIIRCFTDHKDYEKWYKSLK
jgi:mRNA-degrading endonuclease RelE of RelBE toxin-antitoxin system